MKAILAILIITAPAALMAQAAPNGPLPTMNMPNDSTFQTMAGNYSASTKWSDDLPTRAVQQRQLSQAIALRDEATQLRVADGGTLSAAHLRYIQRKADAIRAGR